MVDMASNNSDKKKMQRLKPEHCGVPICPPRKTTNFKHFTSKLLAESNSQVKKNEIRGDKSTSGVKKPLPTNKIVTSNTIVSRNIASKSSAVENSEIKIESNKPLIMKVPFSPSNTVKKPIKIKNNSKDLQITSKEIKTSGKSIIITEPYCSDNEKVKPLSYEPEPSSKINQKQLIKNANCTGAKSTMDFKHKNGGSGTCKTQNVHTNQQKPSESENYAMRKRKVDFKETNVREENVLHTPRPNLDSVNKYIRYMKHNGVFITPKAKSTPVKMTSAFKTPKPVLQVKDVDNKPDVTGIESLVGINENEMAPHKEAENGKRASSIKDDNNEQPTGARIDHAFAGLENVCQLINTETIEFYEAKLDDYKIYCDDLSNMFTELLLGAKKMLTTLFDEERRSTSMEIPVDIAADSDDNDGFLAASSTNVTSITQIINGVTEINDEHVDTAVGKEDTKMLKKQISALEEKLFESQNDHNRLRSNFESVTFETIKNVVTFEKTVMNCLNLLQRQIEVYRYNNASALSRKDDAIRSLKGDLSAYQLKLQENNDRIVLLKAKKEDAEEAMSYRNGRVIDISFPRVVDELVFAANRASNNSTNPAYKLFYRRFLEFMSTLKRSMSDLNLDFYLSLPVADEQCRQCSSVTTAATSTIEVEDKKGEICPPRSTVSSEEGKKDEICLRSVVSSEEGSEMDKIETMVKLLNALSDNVDCVRTRNANFDELWNQLSDRVIDEKKNVDVGGRAKLKDAYRKLTDRILNATATIADSSYENGQQARSLPGHYRKMETPTVKLVKNNHNRNILSPINEFANDLHSLLSNDKQQSEVKTSEKSRRQNEIIAKMEQHMFLQDLKNVQLDVNPLEASYNENKENNYPAIIN